MLKLGVAGQLVEVVRIGLVVLAVMKVERLGAHVRL